MTLMDCTLKICKMRGVDPSLVNETRFTHMPYKNSIMEGIVIKTEIELIIVPNLMDVELIYSYDTSIWKKEEDIINDLYQHNLSQRLIAQIFRCNQASISRKTK